MATNVKDKLVTLEILKSVTDRIPSGDSPSGDGMDKHLLSLSNNKIYDGSTQCTHSYLKNLLMNTDAFVVLVNNDRAYHPNRITNEQVVFMSSYVSNGYITEERISISADNVVTTTYGTSEAKVNKVGVINDSNKDDEDKYPSVKAVADLVGEVKEDLNDLKEQGISGGSASVTGLKSILTDMVTFMKSVPFDDSTASATDLDSIQNKIDKLSESETPPSGGDEEPDEPNPPIEEPDEPTEPEWVDVESQMFSYNYITAYTDDGNTIDESYNPSGGQTCRITTEPFEKDGVVELAITKVESVVILDLRSGLVRNPTMANSQYFDVWYSKKINHMDFGSTRNDRFTLETNGSVQIPVKAGYHFVLFIKNSQNVFPDTYTWSLKYKEGA